MWDKDNSNTDSGKGEVQLLGAYIEDGILCHEAKASNTRTLAINRQSLHECMNTNRNERDSLGRVKIIARRLSQLGSASRVKNVNHHLHKLGDLDQLFADYESTCRFIFDLETTSCGSCEIYPTSMCVKLLGSDDESCCKKSKYYEMLCKPYLISMSYVTLFYLELNGVDYDVVQLCIGWMFQIYVNPPPLMLNS